MKYCSKCGSKVKDGVKFCGCCGEKLEEIKNSTESGNQKDKSVNLYNSSINNNEINKNIVNIYWLCFLYKYIGVDTKTCWHK